MKKHEAGSIQLCLYCLFSSAIINSEINSLLQTCVSVKLDIGSAGFFRKQDSFLKV
jgi:hypothetical protein